MSEATTIKHLHAEKRWVLWKYEERNGKRTKVPYTIDGSRRASSSDQTTWGLYPDTVLRGFDGVGVMLGNGLVGIDIDSCIIYGKLSEFAEEIVQRVCSYTEYSPSGKGIHIIAYANVSEERRKRHGKLEIYSQGRFFTVTNAIYNDMREVHERTEEINAVIEDYLPQPIQRPAKQANKPWTGVVRLSNSEILDIVRKSKQAQKFNSLWRGEIIGYQSQSEAEMALANIFAFYSDSAEQIESLLRDSGLARPKWNTHKTYLQDTINNALQTVTEKWKPRDANNVVSVSNYHTDTEGVITTGASKDAGSETITAWWYLDSKRKLCVQADAFLQFLSKQGFCKHYTNNERQSEGYEFVHVQGRLLRVVTPVMIKDYVLRFIETQLPSFLNCTDSNGETVEIASSELRQIVIRGHKTLFIAGFLEFLQTRSFDMLLDDAETAYVLYSNCIAIVSKGGVKTMDYSDLQAFVWADSIRKDTFENVELKEDSIFARFVRNVCTNRATKEFNSGKFAALCTTLGYMMHRYKNPALAKAVFLTDEVISDTPEGRTGKGVLSKALSYMRNQLRIDGKGFVADSNFAWQQITEATDIVEINDVHKHFKIETLFAAITDDMTVNRKGKPAVNIPFAKSPKFLISANFAIDSISGSARARLIEIELSDYYSADFTPVQEFGVMFWHGWSEHEQAQFHAFMLFCLEMYFTEGLVTYQPANLREKTLTRFTHESFLEYMSTEVVFDAEIESRAFYDNYMQNHFTGSAKYAPSRSKFAAWVKMWAKVYNHSVEFKRLHGKNNRGFIIKKGA